MENTVAFSNSGPKQIVCDSGGPDNIKIMESLTFTIGINFGGKKKVKENYF